MSINLASDSGELPLYTTPTGTPYEISPDGTVIPGIVLAKPSGKWDEIKSSVRTFVTEHLWEDFRGNVEIQYSTPTNRDSVTGIICYAKPNGAAGFDVHVTLTNTVH